MLLKYQIIFTISQVINYKCVAKRRNVTSIHSLIKCSDKMNRGANGILLKESNCD